MKTTILSYLTLLLLILAGCEAPIHDNFVDIERPGEIPLGINLNAFTEGENIIIYHENTPIYYTFETAGREVLLAEFTLGDLQWSTWGESGEIWISPYQLPNGNYTLTCTLYVATNTGSIAEQAGMEAYGGTMSWRVTVAYEKEPTEVPEMTTRINEESYLELIWEKPNYKYMNFLNYTVYKRGELMATIEDADITSFVDKSHVLDYSDWYNVYANFADNVCWLVGHKSLPHDNITIEQVEDISAIDSCTVKWSNGKGYKCKWNVYVNQELKLKETEETSIRIPVFPFGTWQSDLHHVYIELLTYDESDRNSSYSYSLSSAAGSMGKFLGDNFMRFGYNENENALYYSVYGEINSISVPDLNPIAQHNDLPGSSNTNAINGSEKNGKMLVSYGNVLALYEGKMLPTPLTHPIPYSVNGQRAQILNDDRVVYLDQDYPNIIVYILSADMKLEKKVVLQEAAIYGNYYGVISADGKYIHLNNSIEGAIYRMSPEFDVLEKKVYPINNEKEYTHIQFVPHNSSQILIEQVSTGMERTITIYNIENMTPAHSYKARFANIDPKTGYLCLTQKDRTEIIDINSGEILFSLPSEEHQQVYLLGGILISDFNGRALNINPYLEKNKL